MWELSISLGRRSGCYERLVWKAGTGERQASSSANFGNIAGGSSTTYNADNEQVIFNGTSQTFDANGNLTGDGTSTYTWDGRNHLTAISGGSSASFVYDGVGRRQMKTINGTTTQFLYDGFNSLRELDIATPPAVTANLLDGLNIDEHFRRTASSANSTFLTGDYAFDKDGWFCQNPESCSNSLHF